MKPLFTILLCYSFSILAQQQWQVTECDKTAKKLQQLEQKISSGYSVKEAKPLSQEQRLLEKQLDQFCQQPVLASAQKSQK